MATLGGRNDGDGKLEYVVVVVVVGGVFRFDSNLRKNKLRMEKNEHKKNHDPIRASYTFLINYTAMEFFLYDKEI